MNKFKDDAKAAASDIYIVDEWGASTGGCEQSFTQGAEWGYRKAVEELRTDLAANKYCAYLKGFGISPEDWADWLLERAGIKE